MKIGMYPFASTGSIPDNLRAIESAAQLAAGHGVRLLFFHECALCGYPPIESSITNIHPAEIEAALSRVAHLAFRHHMYIAVGTVRFEAGRRFNSILLFDDTGKLAGSYDKSALWGWDCDHFERGSHPGVFEIDGVKAGFRICYDVRFPECFRSLYLRKAEICIVAFSDTSETPDPGRYQLIRAHLMTRAAENSMTVISVNSASRHSTAPTAVFDPDGRVLFEADPRKPSLHIYDYRLSPVNFSRQGRIENTEYFLKR